MTEDRVAPRTAAGRWLLRMEAYNSRSFALITPEHILRVEAEAASLDRDELRKAVEALHGVCHSRSGLMCDTHPCNENVERAAVLALLSAGDKAEAPAPVRDDLDEITGPES